MQGHGQFSSASRGKFSAAGATSWGKFPSRPRRPRRPRGSAFAEGVVSKTVERLISRPGERDTKVSSPRTSRTARTTAWPRNFGARSFRVARKIPRIRRVLGESAERCSRADFSTSRVYTRLIISTSLFYRPRAEGGARARFIPRKAKTSRARSLATRRALPAAREMCSRWSLPSVKVSYAFVKRRPPLFLIRRWYYSFIIYERESSAASLSRCILLIRRAYSLSLLIYSFTRRVSYLHFILHVSSMFSHSRSLSRSRRYIFLFS